MDEEAFKAAVARLNEVNKVIEGLDAAIRADAFKLLKPYVSSGAPEADEDDDEEGADEKPEKETRIRGGGSVDFDKLIEAHESDKDSENAVLALAIVYARHGKGPYPMSVIKGVANEFNLTIPSRPDKFFATHKRNTKEVLRKQSDGWKITPSGETWLKESYKVARGKQPIATSDES